MSFTNQALGLVNTAAQAAAVKSLTQEAQAKKIANKEKVITEHQELVDEKAGLENELTGLDKSVSDARKEKNDAGNTLSFNHSKEAQAIYAKAEKKLKDAQYTRKWQREIINQRLAANKEKMDLNEEKARLYKVEGLYNKGGKK